MPADGGGIEKNLRAMQCCEPGRFGVPLVPAHTDANACEFRVPGPKTQVPRSEVELLVKKRIVRDMHLAVLPEIGSVGIDDCSGVVIDARRAALEKRSDDHRLELLRDLLQLLCRRSWDGLCKFKVFVIFDLAE